MHMVWLQTPRTFYGPATHRPVQYWVLGTGYVLNRYVKLICVKRRLNARFGSASEVEQLLFGVETNTLVATNRKRVLQQKQKVVSAEQ